MEFIPGNLWGILLVVVIFVLAFGFLDRKIAKEMAWNFVMEVEKNAREYGLEFVRDKKAWVRHWYDYLPPTIKFFVSRKLWDKIVESIYDQLPDHESK